MDMSNSRISRIGDVLLLQQSGKAHLDYEIGEACYQLAERLELRFPGLLLDTCTDDQRQRLLVSLAEIMKSDSISSELMEKIVPMPPPPPPPTPKKDGKRPRRPVQLLFLNALPRFDLKLEINSEGDLRVQKGQSVLRSDHEHRGIQTALNMSRYRDSFYLQTALGVRTRDLRRHLLKHTPDIVHFSGHGQEGCILIERDDGSYWPLPGKELAELFSIIKGIRCVVLNACMTESAADPIAKATGTVISWPGAVRDKRAIVFAKCFYEALASGRTVGDAFELGCWQIKEDFGEGLRPVISGDRALCFINSSS
jgi:hypothetical protein